MTNDTLLFDSVSRPVPEMRRDLQIIPLANNGKNLLYFHDSMGYVSPNFALDRQVESVLSLITGTYSITQISKLLNNSINTNDLLAFIQLLDQHRILDTNHFRFFSNRIEKDFEASKERPPALAGDSYPRDSDQLTASMDNLFSGANGSGANPAKGLYAPHIDLRVGQAQYAEAFSTLRKMTPSRVVFFGTSHYAGYYNSLYESYPFIGSEKRFILPGRSLNPDLEYLQLLSQSGDESGFTVSDRAHRVEHSIETHLLFLNHLWKHDFRIVPILISGFDELFYHSSGRLAEQIEKFTTLIRKLDDDDTFYLVSGDLSHVGKKFGDPLPASQLREEVEKTDWNFIQAAKAGDSFKLTDLIAKDYDATRICGYPPLYTFLKAFPGIKGELINYHWWDESERESAVSFGSIAY